MVRSQSSPVCDPVHTGPPTGSAFQTSARLPSSLYGNRSFWPVGCHNSGRRHGHARKRSHRTRREQQRVLFSLIHGSKEGRNKTSGDKSKASKQIHHHPNVSNGVSSDGRKGYPTERLGNLCRPQRCLLPCTNTSQAPAVSKIHLEGTGLPVSIDPFRPVHSPLYVYQGHPSRDAVVQGSRYEDNLLPGRCPPASTHPSSLQQTYQDADSKAQITRFHDQCQKIRTYSSPVVLIPGSLLGLSGYASIPARGQDLRDPVLSRETAQSRPPDFPGNTAVSGQSKLCLHSCSQGQTQVQGSSEKFSKGSFQSVPKSQALPRVQTSSTVVGGTPRVPCPSSVSGTIPNSNHGCFLPGMGSLPFLPIHQGPVAPVLAKASSQAHKRTRNEGRSVSSPTLGSLDVGQDCSTLGRQFGYSPLPQKRGGDQISYSIQTCHRSSGHMLQSPYPSNPQSPPGTGEHPVRCSVQAKTPGRVASTSVSCRKNLFSPGSPRNRPVRLPADGSAPRVLLSGQARSTSSGNRCPSPTLGLPGYVCISSPGNASPYHPEVSPARGQAHPRSPILDRGPMVPRGGLHALPATPQAPVQVQPDNQQIHQPAPILPQPPPPDGLAAFKTAVRASGASEDVAQFLSTSWRGSTRSQYQSVWRTWVAWCEDSRLEPSSLSVNKLLDYLLYLHSVKNLSWNTIGVHRSAISSLLSPLVSFGEHPLVARFMRALFLQKPPSVQPRWTWDMASVLTYVKNMGLPHSLDLRQLTWKLTFLIAVFSARRMADLTLLRVTPQYLQLSADSAVFQPAFGAKQDRPGHQNPILVLRSYTDKALCPVTTLREYLTRTRYGNRDVSLFLTTTPPFRKAAKATIKRWIIMLLRAAGVQASPGSTRAAAASFALARNVSLQSIMESADWSRSKTVFRHYIRLLSPDILAHIARKESGNVQAAVLSTL